MGGGEACLGLLGWWWVVLGLSSGEPTSDRGELVCELVWESRLKLTKPRCASRLVHTLGPSTVVAKAERSLMSWAFGL